MKEKLNCVVLIDDDDSTNFINKHILRLADCSQTILEFESAKQALDYLCSENNETKLLPDLIFLDINMPGMNGWEFLDEFEKISPDEKQPPAIVMLTASINPDDEIRARKNKWVKDFKSKPISPTMVHDLLKEHFPNHLAGNEDNP